MQYCKQGYFCEFPFPPNIDDIVCVPPGSEGEVQISPNCVGGVRI